MNNVEPLKVDFSPQKNQNNFNGNYSSGGGGGNMEARIARLESDVENIKININDIKQDIRETRAENRADFKITFGALITVALGLACLMAKGFGWL